jgi:hypothetical protein
MFGRLLGVIATSGIIAAVGFMLAPRRRNRFRFSINRLPFSLRDLKRMMRTGQKLVRAVAR